MNRHRQAARQLIEKQLNERRLTGDDLPVPKGVKLDAWHDEGWKDIIAANINLFTDNGADIVRFTPEDNIDYVTLRYKGYEFPLSLDSSLAHPTGKLRHVAKSLPDIMAAVAKDADLKDIFYSNIFSIVKRMFPSSQLSRSVAHSIMVGALRDAGVHVHS
jgi:hypothetical protein